jgi:hypothetical protein
VEVDTRRQRSLFGLRAELLDEKVAVVTR